MDYCLIYDSQRNTCLKCENGMFLSKEGLCQNECAQGYVVSPYKLNKNFENNVFSEHFFKCTLKTDYSMTTFVNNPIQC